MIINTHGIGDMPETAGLQQTVNTLDQWTPLEWAIVLGGAYVLWSVFFTTRHYHGLVSDKVSKVKSKSQKRSKILKELDEV